MANSNKKRLLFLGAGTIIFFLVAISAMYAPRFLSSPSSSSSSQFSFINPAVIVKIDKHFIINIKPLREKFLDIQKKYSQKTYVYFNYLNNASWVGINEREEFTAASTVKVPLAMSLYKAAEEGKLKLSDIYSLDKLDLDEGFGGLYKKGADNKFAVEEFAKIMLEQSDNTAMRAVKSIFKNIGIDDPLFNVYRFMGWEVYDAGLIPEFGQQITYQKINLKTLANMFITLYNAEYVNMEHSQKILEFLANSPFNDKIAAGVPPGIAVAHKIGVSVPDDTFSDCGIVYAPGRHYLLCVGSNGGDEKIAAKFMEEISGAAYDFVINN